MSTVKYKVYDLDTAQSEFDTIMDILADNEALLDGIIIDLEAYSSNTVTMLTTQISDFKNMHAQMNQDMTSAKSEIKEIETSATEKFKPINEANLLSLKTPEVLEALKGIGEVLNEDLSKESLAPSTGFIEWINARDNELNDGLIETALNPIDEYKQRKAEAVYHANQAVYENAYANFVDDITFKTEIDYIERVISEVDGFSKEDFPVIAEGNLYESLFDSAVGVSYSDFTETVISDYDTDTNGIFPDSVEGWFTAAATVGFIIYAGVEVLGLELLSTFASRLGDLILNEYLYQIEVVSAASSRNYIKSNIMNTLSFGGTGFVSAFSENELYNARILANTFIAPVYVVDKAYSVTIGGEEVVEDIKHKKYIESICDSVQTVFYPIPSFVHLDDEFEVKIDKFFGGDYQW